MTGQNAGKIMPADSIRPCFDERLDLGFRRLALLHHGCCSEYWLVSAPRTNVGAHIRHASKLFRGGGASPPLSPFGHFFAWGNFLGGPSCERPRAQANWKAGEVFIYFPPPRGLGLC